jgi:hypothetical protein
VSRRKITYLYPRQAVPKLLALDIPDVCQKDVFGTVEVCQKYYRFSAQLVRAAAPSAPRRRATRRRGRQRWSTLALARIAEFAAEVIAHWRRRPRSRASQIRDDYTSKRRGPFAPDDVSGVSEDLSVVGRMGCYRQQTSIEWGNQLSIGAL